MILKPAIASRLFDAPLMIDARKLAAIMAGIGGKIVDGGVMVLNVAAIDHVSERAGRLLSHETAGVLGDPLGARLAKRASDQLMTMRDGVAVIPVEGTLVHKGDFLGAYSGETSYEGIQTQVIRAGRDPDVKAVVFEIDSFGGEVAGAFDTAAMIRDLARKKPTLAILTDFALSAGYLLASAVQTIVIPETGFAGSIGVIAMHADFSAQLDQQGIKVTVIASGAHKADGHPALPLASEVRDRLQGLVDASRDLFAAAVASYRGAKLDKVAALATEAAIFRGADAVKAGLADQVERPSEAFDRFIAGVNRWH